MKKEKISIPMTTLDFYKYEIDGIIYYEFDATECSPPEPMVNTLNALRMIKNENERLVGYFFHEPVPLYAKIADSFVHEAKELENGDYKITFKKT
ncbi:DUF2249 domain-containing protein [Sulfurimonas paralvinellae]|uniref:DUF2249 domain-containing protein n=2 Tax=Sulfurimonas paralvinellae TaxID=317658 RepID=A0A7M1B754_9BACT|nr:DUF2249 domain-containing protein [Sulfurimonas paralvinellae]